MPVTRYLMAGSKAIVQNLFCPYCHNSFVLEEKIVDCPICDRTYHCECWFINGNKCSFLLECSGSGPIEERPSPAEILKLLKKAIDENETGNNDQKILQIWQDNPELKAYPPASKYLKQINLVLRRQNALKELQAAISSGSDIKILEIWRIHQKLLENYLPAKPYQNQVMQAQQRLAALKALETAIATDLDEKIVEVWELYEELLKSYPAAQPYRQRVTEAQQRLEAIDKLKKAIENDDDKRIINLWRSHKKAFQNHPAVQDLLERIQLAEQYEKALQILVKAVHSPTSDIWDLHGILLKSYPALSDCQARVNLAKQLRQSLAAFRQALGNEDGEKVAEIYLQHKRFLAISKALSPQEWPVVQRQFQRLVQQKATPIRRGIWEEDDEKISAAYNESFNKSLFALFSGSLSPDQQWRVAVAQQRSQALKELREAIKDGNPAVIVRRYTEAEALLKPCENFSMAERQSVIATQRAYLSHKLRAAMQQDDEEQIVKVGQQAIEANCRLQTDDYEAIRRAGLRVAARRQLEQAIAENDEVAIVNAYQPDLIGQRQGLADQYRERVELAQKRLRRWYPLQQALASRDDNEVAKYYDRELFDDSKLLGWDERERCALAQRRQEAFPQLKKALAGDNDDYLLEVYEKNEALLGPSSLLTQVERLRLKQLKQKRDRLVNFEKALQNGKPLDIAEAYQALLEAGGRLPDTAEWPAIFKACQQVETINKLRQALKAETPIDEEIARLGRRLLHLPPEQQELTSVEQDQLRSAIQRVGAVQRLSWANRGR